MNANNLVLALALCTGATLAQHYQGHYTPHYMFEYNVHDPQTGDVKVHRETSQGDVVKGFYALKEPDGTLREVHYTADKKNGFNAEVRRIGHAVHPLPHNYEY